MNRANPHPAPLLDPQTRDALPTSEAVRTSLADCHDAARRCDRGLYDALELAPEPNRSALCTIHAFARACDDSAADPDTAMAQLEAFRAQMVQALNTPPGVPSPPGPIWPALRHVVHAYAIDPAHLHAMIDGRRQDLVQRRYASFPGLYGYCEKTGAAMELACLPIWGCDGDPQTRRLAEYRGIAFELTHLLRNLAADAARGRVYLPADELERFGYSAEDLARKAADRGFHRLMVYQVERARSYYQMSAPLEQHLAPGCRAASWAMTRIHSGLLDQIARSPRRVLRERVHLGRLQKLRIALHAGWRARRASR